MKKILLSAAIMLLVIPAVFNTSDISAQTVSVKVGTEQEEKKKEEPKKVFGMKSETTIGGSRIENLGKYFLDILLININTGAMWAIDTKGFTFSYKNTRLKYIPAVDTSW